MIEGETKALARGSRLDAPQGRYTTSFGLLAHVKRPRVRFDVVPVLDLMMLALLISLLFTRFVMLPGVRVALPATDLRMQHDASAVAVLTIGNQGMLFFDGTVYKLGSIERAFRSHIKAAGAEDCILLVKAQAAMELQLFLDLCQMAQEAGFVQVQIAAERAQAASELAPGDALAPAGGERLPSL